MCIEGLNKSPVLVLKDCISKEFAEILEEPRVQHLMLLLDRINTSWNTILDNGEKCHISFYRDMIEKDTTNFNKSITILRADLNREFMLSIDLKRVNK
jgi:hypothetical protein